MTADISDDRFQLPGRLDTLKVENMIGDRAQRCGGRPRFPRRVLEVFVVSMSPLCRVEPPGASKKH